MLFSSVTFLFYFLPVLFGVLFFLSKNIKASNLALLVTSLVFYAWGEPVFVVIMLASIGLNYVFGRLIDKYQPQKKLLLTLGIIANLGILVYFKYFSFLISSFAGMMSLKLDVPEITLPLGISFFTFQAITYLFDLYRGEIKVQKSIANLALYISFFPQLIAGPIVRYHDIEQQITDRTVTKEDFTIGVRRFIIGLSKKVIIANQFAIIADEIFALPESDLTRILVVFAIVSYTIQIYFDFSGYSDMAIGLGRMCGFKFLENFNYPYVATSIQEFWRRWHISLSNFLRDYLYIPLGGSRAGAFKTYRNLIIVFVLCGLWHGAGLNFIVWGAYFGFFLVLERLFLGKILQKLPKIISWAYMIIVVMLSWLIFRAESMEQVGQMLSVIFSDAYNPIYKKYAKDALVQFMLSVAIFAATPIFKRKILASGNTNIQFAADAFLLLCFIVSVSFLAAGTYNPFIYFRF